MFAEQWRWLPRKQIPAELNLPSSLQHISASPSHYNLLRVLQNIITIGMTPHKGRITALFNKAGVTVFQRNKQWAELWSWSKELFTRALVFRFKCRTIWLHRVVSRHSWSHQDWHPSPMILAVNGIALDKKMSLLFTVHLNLMMFKVCHTNGTTPCLLTNQKSGIKLGGNAWT